MIRQVVDSRCRIRGTPKPPRRYRLHPDALRYIGAAQAFAMGRIVGVCPCASLAEDPGPKHIEVCPFRDEDYGGSSEWRPGDFERAVATEIGRRDRHREVDRFFDADTRGGA